MGCHEQVLQRSLELDDDLRFKGGDAFGLVKNKISVKRCKNQKRPTMKFLSSLAFALSSGELTEQEAVAKPDTKEAWALGFQKYRKGTYQAGGDDFGAHLER